METKDLFLAKIDKRIASGEFDDQLNLPFTSTKLLKTAIEDKVNKRDEAGKTPMLSETEIKNLVEDVREVGVSTYKIFKELGLWEKDADGALKISKKGAMAIKQSFLL